MSDVAESGVGRSTVRSSLWLWGHDAGSHDHDWGLPRPSRITTAEAAFYLCVPNIVMVRYKGRPPLPLDQFAVPLQALRQVVWSVVGAHGETNQSERSHVIGLAGRHPNVSGVMLDDFFRDCPQPGEELAALSIDELRELRGSLSSSGRRLNLWVVVYEHQLDQQLAEYLAAVDKVSLWTWDAEKTRDIERSLLVLEALAPNRGKYLGVYMWDYGRKKAMPVELLQKQCESGLAWLRDGRIEGLVFLASCICDLELEAVEWTRNWIAKVGDQIL